MIQKIKAYKIKGNPENPRIVKNIRFKELVDSIKSFPEMLEKRAIVVDENFMILGGNMRWKACQEIGLKDIWIDMAEGWSDDQKKEFTIRDNSHSGEWDWDILANEWDIDQLNDWGLFLPDYETNNIDVNDPETLNEDENATCPSCGKKL